MKKCSMDFLFKLVKVSKVCAIKRQEVPVYEHSMLLCITEHNVGSRAIYGITPLPITDDFEKV